MFDKQKALNLVDPADAAGGGVAFHRAVGDAALPARQWIGPRNVTA